MVIYPRPLFGHHATHRNLSVYCTDTIPASAERVLTRADMLLTGCPLYNPETRHTVYLCNNYRLMRYLFIRETYFGVNLFTGDTFLTHGDFDRDLAWYGPDDHPAPFTRTLSGSIVHEVTHSLIRSRVGFFADRKIPSWFKEGYCDMIAHDSLIDSDSGLDMLLSGKRRGRRLTGFKHRVMVDYLINTEKRSIMDLLKIPPDYEATESDAVNYLKEHRQDILDRLERVQ